MIKRGKRRKNRPEQNYQKALRLFFSEVLKTTPGTQFEISQRLDVYENEISRFMRNEIPMSTNRIFHLLTKVSCDIEIQVTKPTGTRTYFNIKGE